MQLDQLALAVEEQTGVDLHGFKIGAEFPFDPFLVPALAHAVVGILPIDHRHQPLLSGHVSAERDVARHVLLGLARLLVRQLRGIGHERDHSTQRQDKSRAEVPVDRLTFGEHCPRMNWIRKNHLNFVLTAHEVRRSHCSK